MYSFDNDDDDDDDDRLSFILESVYGGGARWRRLFDSNRFSIQIRQRHNELLFFFLFSALSACARVDDGLGLLKSAQQQHSNRTENERTENNKPFAPF